MSLRLIHSEQNTPEPAEWRWSVLHRLLSVMPGVRRPSSTTDGWLGNDSADPEARLIGPVPQWLPSEGQYPRRVLASTDWLTATDRARLELVQSRPADWVLCEGELHEVGGEVELQRSLMALMRQLHERGGYLILQVPTSGYPDESTWGEQMLYGPFEFWLSAVDRAADFAGYDTTWLWSSMLRFALLRARAKYPDEILALQQWTVDSLLMVEVRPMKRQRKQVEPEQRESLLGLARRWLGGM